MPIQRLPSRALSGAIPTANLPPQISIHSAASAGALAIDANSRITIPYQPAFNVAGCTGTTAPGIADTWSTVEVNVGNHFNATTGTFTAPVAGRYYFYGNFMGDGSSTYTYFRFQKNGSSISSYHHTNSNLPSYRHVSGDVIVDMSASDTMWVYILQTGLYGATANGVGTNWSSMGGYLIG